MSTESDTNNDHRRRTIHDCISSLAFMPNVPKTLLYAGLGKLNRKTLLYAGLGKLNRFLKALRDPCIKQSLIHVLPLEDCVRKVSIQLLSLLNMYIERGFSLKYNERKLMIIETKTLNLVGRVQVYIFTNKHQSVDKSIQISYTVFPLIIATPLIVAPPLFGTLKHVMS